MPTPEKQYEYQRVIILIFMYLLLIYSNTFQVPFLFDDQQNILERTDLQLTRITPDTVMDTFFTNKFGGEKFYRPISCLSFALNYRMGGYRVAGYHMVNVLIHLIATLFLYKTILLLLGLGNIRLTDREKIFIAGLSTVLWASHPIQAQAVNYIVQRMASLAAMFYIIGLWSYIRFRQTFVQSGWLNSIKWMLIAIFSFLSAILSKENAAIFPLGVLLIEFFFFDGYKKIRKKPIQIFCFTGALLLIPILIGYFFFNTGGLENILSGYETRPFTATQRLLTQSRVLFLYISQLIYPIPSKFSLVHYIPFSDSLFSPITTLLATAGILIGILTAFVIGRRYPLIAFPVVFYFFHHIVESSIIPLEMIYEHRNYLPSFFFFLPIAVALVKGLNFYKKQNKFIWSSLLVFITAIIFLFGLSTHLRNQDWQSVKSFWTKELKNTPELIRPYLAMGWVYTRQNSRNLDIAYYYFKKGVEKKEYFIKFEKGDLWLNIAKIHQERHEYEKAKLAALKSLEIYQEKIRALPDLGKRDGVKKKLSLVYKTLADISAYTDTESSLRYIEKAIEMNDSAYCYADKAIYLIKINKQEAAIQALQKAFEKSDKNEDALFIAAHLYTSKGNYAKGYWFYQQYMKQEIDLSQDLQPIYLFMAENRYLAGATQLGDKYLNKFIQAATLQQISSIIKKINSNYPKTLPFIQKTLIVDKVSDLLDKQSDKIIVQ